MAAKKIPKAMMAQVELETGDLSRLKAELLRRNDKDFKDGEVWQAILNIGYGKWQSLPDSHDWSYDDMVEWVGLEFGPFAKLCILLGKYNQQVLCNGHMGYWDNGFSGGPCADADVDIPLHKQMLHLMRQIGVDRLPAGKKIYEVASRFRIEVLSGDYGCSSEEVMADASVDDDYADVAQYKGQWEKDFNGIIQYLIEQD